MAIKRCENGHIYDPDIYSSCPNCRNDSFRIDFGRTGGDPAHTSGSPGRTGGGFGRTEPVFTPPTVPSGAANSVGKTVAAPGGFVPAGGGLNKTVAVGLGGKLVDVHSDERPVVGWLVCIKGPNAGRSYEIHSDYNYLGSEEGDIVIPGDRKISRAKHMCIAFDPDARSFYAAPEAGANLIRLNGRALMGGAELKNYDRIETGDSSFMFIAFCGVSFGWEDVDGV